MVETSVDVEQTPDGRRLAVRARVPAAPAAAWDLLVDTTTWPEWGPSVTDVDCATRRIGAESTGRVRLPGGLWVPFRVAAFDPGRRWTWTIARVPATGHRVESLAAPTACRVVFEVPPLAAAYVPVCRRALGRIERLLAA